MTAKLATNILLMRRSSPSPRAATVHAATSAELTLAGSALISGQVPRLQIRYRWQDLDWIDTLASGENGFRLVRIAHQKPA
jgi:hypothetical protein